MALSADEEEDEVSVRAKKRAKVYDHESSQKLAQAGGKDKAVRGLMDLMKKEGATDDADEAKRRGVKKLLPKLPAEKE